MYFHIYVIMLSINVNIKSKWILSFVSTLLYTADVPQTKVTKPPVNRGHFISYNEYSHQKVTLFVSWHEFEYSLLSLHVTSSSEANCLPPTCSFQKLHQYDPKHCGHHLPFKEHLGDRLFASDQL